MAQEHADARRKVEDRMKTVAKGLGREPQVESLLSGRRKELGLSSPSPGRNLAQDLARSLGIGRGLSR